MAWLVRYVKNTGVAGLWTTAGDKLYQNFHHIQEKIRFGYGNQAVKNVL
jgi:hypothetical protein